MKLWVSNSKHESISHRLDATCDFQFANLAITPVKVIQKSDIDLPYEFHLTTSHTMSVSHHVQDICHLHIHDFQKGIRGHSRSRLLIGQR
jgi:hypothetical protein